MSITFNSLSLCHSDDVDQLVLSKEVLDGNSLLKMLPSKVYLIRDGATIKLDLHDVRFLLALLQQLGLK